MAFLIVEERGVRRHVPFGHDGRIRIGRAPDNDVILMEEKSSRHHAVVEQTHQGYTVRDLDSLNGCFMGGLRIREQTIGYGESFLIGRARLTLETEQSTAIDATGASSRIGVDTAVGAPVTLAPSGNGQRPQPSPVIQSGARGQVPASSTPNVRPVTSPLSTVGSREPDIMRALAAFHRADFSGDSTRILEVVCEYAGRLVPGTRVAMFVTERGELMPRHFWNFITSAPRDELAKDWFASATKAINTGKVLVQSIAGAPERAYLPIKVTGGEACALLFERESVQGAFSDSDKLMIPALAAQIAAFAGIRGVLDSSSVLKQTVSRLESELGTLREELQKRLDLQTAELTRQREDLSRLVMAPQFRYDYSGIIGRSRPMVELFHLLDKVTDLPVPVLIIGESGTGKELIARALHFNSRRSEKGTFIAENCAALPESLLESELFGHAKGSFTGADRDKIGLFEQATGGTIFLDEIGETTPALQAKLLRVLEEGEIRPVGGNRVRKVDFRLVAATNRPLEDWVKQGKFRQDLFYRINVITVHLPPLRDRKEDIPLLVDRFLHESAEQRGVERIRASSGVMRALVEYQWPGNVRELENEVKRMVALSDGKKLSVDLLSPGIRGGATDDLEATEDMPLKELVERIEARRIQEVIKETDGNKSRAAEKLGLSRLGLRKKMERYGLASPGGEE